MAQERLKQRPIGSVFEVKNVGKVRVVKASIDACAFCAFTHLRCSEYGQLGPCTFRDRSDRTNIIFKLVNERKKAL